MDTTIIPRGETQAGLSAASQGSPSGSEEILLDSRVNDLRLSSGSSGATSEDTQLRLLSVKAQMKAHKSLAKRCGKSFPNLSEATNYAYEQNRRHARTHARAHARTHPVARSRRRERQARKIKVTGEALQPLKDRTSTHAARTLIFPSSLLPEAEEEKDKQEKSRSPGSLCQSPPLGLPHRRPGP